MDIDAWLAENLPSVKAEVGPAQSTTAEGVPYVTLVVGGVKAECQPWPVTSYSAAEAWAGYLQELAAYIGNAKRLVWRQKPTLVEWDDKFYIRSRLVTF